MQSIDDPYSVISLEKQRLARAIKCKEKKTQLSARDAEKFKSALDKKEKT